MKVFIYFDFPEFGGTGRNDLLKKFHDLTANFLRLLKNTQEHFTIETGNFCREYF